MDSHNLVIKLLWYMAFNLVQQRENQTLLNTQNKDMLYKWPPPLKECLHIIFININRLGEKLDIEVLV